jgi:hypothetical protein
MKYRRPNMFYSVTERLLEFVTVIRKTHMINIKVLEYNSGIQSAILLSELIQEHS